MSQNTLFLRRSLARICDNVLGKSPSGTAFTRRRSFWLHSSSLILLFATGLFSAAYSQQPALNADTLTGHFSREGNNDAPAQSINNNIYIKLFGDYTIATLYVPYPYAKSVSPDIVTKVLEQAKHQTSSSAFIRGKFGHLEENATVHVEKFGFFEDQIVFECGSLAPCTIKLHEGYLELIKPGVINEHIIKYHHVKVDG